MKFTKIDQSLKHDHKKRHEHSDGCFSYILIRKNCEWKRIFDNLMLFLSVYSTLVNAYIAAFGIFNFSEYFILENIIELFFLFDFIFCFCQEFQDEETYEMIDCPVLICKKYLKGSFIFDFIALIPFNILFKF